MKRILIPIAALTLMAIGTAAKKSHDMSLQRNLKTFTIELKVVRLR